MLSLDLFDSRYEKRLHEGAVDDAEYARLKKLSEKIDYLKQARAQTKDADMRRAIDQRIQQYDDERKEILSVRGMKEAEQPARPQTQQTKGIGDIQDPKQKMAKLSQQAKKSPLANVGAGLKAFIKGEPEPMGEEQGINPRALGVANFQRLVKANMGNVPTVSLEFIRPEENFKLDQKGLDLISDYYDGLENDQAKNYFIYRVLPSGDETRKILKQLGWNPQQVQPSLPGIPTQGELPLQEKKKSNSDDLEAGDVKVARELQKLRAQYPAARSDVEAVARAEIDSTERSQQQLAAIRGANEKQDALLRQLVALDQEQGREISGLDKENNSLEQRLAQVQATNNRLQQAIGKITSTKKAADQTSTIAPQGSADIAQGGIIDVGTPVPSEPDTTSKVKIEPTTSPAVATMARQLGGFSNVVPLKTMKPGPETELDLETEPAPASIRKAANDGKQEKAAESKVHEHGGGIGPRQHWQDLMQEGQPQELINRYLAIDAETDVEAVRAAIQAISRDPALGANSKSRLLGQIGMIIKRHRLPIGRSYYTYMQQYMEEQDIAETVTDVKSLWAQAYRRLAPRIERHRDSFLAGQLYDELENIAELHGAEGEFKRMMGTARNRAHMEYDTNPGGFQNWFWFLPFEDNDVTEGTDDLKKKMSKLEALALAANRAGDDAKCKMYQQKIQSLKQKLSQSMAEGWSDQGNPTPYSVYIDGREWRAYKSDDHARAVAEKVRNNLERQGRDQTVTIAPSRTKRVQEDFGMPGTTIPRKSLIQGYTVFWNPKTQVVSVTRGGDSEEAAIEQARVGTPSLKNFRQAADRLIDKIEATDEQIINENIRDTASATAVIACLLTGGSLTGCATAPQQTSAQQVLKTGQDIGRTVQTAKKITRAGTEAEVQQELRNILRGISRPEELNNSNIIRIWKRIKGQPPVQPEPEAPEYGPAEPVRRPATFEAKEIVSKEDFIRERDRLLRMIGIETDPANKQILKSAIRQLENRAENEGWITIQSRMVREDSDGGEAVEMAIMRRMLIAHTDLIVEFGLDKVVAAIEEVAYDVGDTDEIGSSDVSGWVRQVKQILGADA